MKTRTETLALRASVAALALIGAVAISSAAEACEVNVGRGWARGSGNGTLVMAKGGKNCGGSLLADPNANRPVTSLKVVSSPANGRVTVRGNTFQYTPKAGFQGQDSFSLTGSGPDRAGTMMTLTGNIAVTVQ